MSELPTKKPFLAVLRDAFGETTDSYAPGDAAYERGCVVDPVYQDAAGLVSIDAASVRLSDVLSNQFDTIRAKLSSVNDVGFMLSQAQHVDESIYQAECNKAHEQYKKDRLPLVGRFFQKAKLPEKKKSLITHRIEKVHVFGTTLMQHLNTLEGIIAPIRALEQQYDDFNARYHRVKTHLGEKVAQVDPSQDLLAQHEYLLAQLNEYPHYSPKERKECIKRIMDLVEEDVIVDLEDIPARLKLTQIIERDTQQLRDSFENLKYSALTLDSELTSLSEQRTRIDDKLVRWREGFMKQALLLRRKAEDYSHAVTLLNISAVQEKIKSFFTDVQRLEDAEEQQHRAARGFLEGNVIDFEADDDPEVFFKQLGEPDAYDLLEAKLLLKEGVVGESDE